MTPAPRAKRTLTDRLVGLASAQASLRRAKGLADRGRAARAFPLFARAARAGIAEAEFRLARCYLESAGVPVSRVEGVRWLERAATRGFVEAQAMLAALYAQGLGSPHGAAGEPGAGAAATLFMANDFERPRFRARREMGPSGSRGRLGRRSGDPRLHP